MASDVKLAIRRDQAIATIEDSMVRLADELGIDAPDLAPSRRWGMDHYHVVQLERIAAFFDQVSVNENQISSKVVEMTVVEDEQPEVELPDYESMTVAELEAEAKESGIYDAIEGTGSSGNVIKADLVAALLNTEKVSDGDAD